MRILFGILFTIFLLPAGAVDVSNDINSVVPESTDFVSIDELLYREPDDTACATAAFADALARNASNIAEDASETEMQAWIYDVFRAPETLDAVLACPEIANADDNDAIKFLPIEYTFPGGRQVTINYETNPRILKQRDMLGDKRSVDSMNPSPRIGAAGDTSEWANTDPAWYAIMVVQRGALDAFAGPGKNYTISLEYIRQNIDDMFPKNRACTRNSALATKNNPSMINQAMHKLVNIEDDSNAYYVAGDVNLQWISYLEIGLDVIITVATVGMGTAILGTTKGARASRTLKNLTQTIRTLSKSEKVRDYIRASSQYTRAAQQLKKLDKAKDAAAYAKAEKEMKAAGDAMRELEKLDDVKNTAMPPKVLPK